MCFLTNGGGVTEAAKAAELSEWLGVSVGADQVDSHLGPRHSSTCQSTCAAGLRRMMPADAAVHGQPARASEHIVTLCGRRLRFGYVPMRQL